MKIYRVTAKISYHETKFDFRDGSTAINFMDVAASHVSQESENGIRLTMEIVETEGPEPEEEQKEEEEEF